MLCQGESLLKLNCATPLRYAGGMRYDSCMTLIDTPDAQFIARMIDALAGGTLIANHECPECNTRFESMFDAATDHTVIPFPGEGGNRWSGEFSIIIACEGYHIMNDEGMIRPIE